MYGSDGRMSAILMAPDRPLLGGPGFVPADPAAKLEAANGYVSYAGTFQVVDDQVQHTVTHSLYPDWIGQVLTREMQWQDGDLILTTPATQTRSGKTVFDEIRWRRLGPTDSEKKV